MKKIIVPVLAGLALVSSSKAAEATSLEALLPAETVLVMAASDYASAKKHFKASASGQFWDSAEFRPFRKKLADGFEANVLAKIEEELAVDFEAFEEMASGPVALAVVPGQAAGEEPALLLLLDAGRKSFTLRRTLSRMERDWKKADRNVSETEIGEVDFTTVSDPEGQGQVHIGRVDAQLIVGTAAGQIEGILARLGGGGGGSLAGNPAFVADHGALLKGADFYLWANLGQVIPQLLDNAPDGAELGIDFGEVFGSLGLNGLDTFAITYSERPDGAHSDVFVGLPEAKRKGLFGLLNTKRADASPPPFVPANVGAFTRWRVDMGAAWKNLEKLLLELSPDVANMVEFTVGLLGKDKDSNFDFKKSFLNNFGDDLILYQMPPKGKSLNDLGSGSIVALFKSPNPAELIKGIGAVPGILPPPLNEAVLEPRKLGNHTAHSFGVMQLPDPSTGELVASEVLFAVKDGYLAVSTDADLMQGLLDGKTQPPLARRNRLAAAAAVVGGTDSGFFAYQNDRVMMLSMMDTLRANADQFEMIFSMIPMEELDEVSLDDWLDFSLLPAGEKIAKYFDVTVYGAGTDARGVTLKMFSPRPQNLKR
ncbi:MAG: hypothetical protein QF749_03345 [Verrucomicrobiota bacterium]|jgi:hypothetical protein|nr:hypothetical protein [Verrucomicrobiota bacterium]MDP6251649.1 hypothetical protein [Verrucomicrobiota bacterium]MDP7177304.1 hypothetical protein [Verrucomicrobiota bacterium]MDP7290841.1 hypothetical protein [Verrucomicrobiota bacterium]MDP7440452.1 hypothetical protein [Verrucomicrobiota bacterium]|tara:strand:- start:3909 stop:5696 length:1788 start_codon:yes stop_codon:yes gene_type:complete